MSKMRSYLKPPLPKSPIRLRSRQIVHSSLQTPPGYQKTGRRLSDVDRNPKTPIEYSLISREIHALAKSVKDEFAEEENKKSRGVSADSNLESLAADSAPLFERGRFYEEYSARRNERLRRKKGEQAVEEGGGGGAKGTPYNLGVNHEPMSNKRRGTSKKQQQQSIKKKTVSMVESTPRYSLRSTTKGKPPLPLNVTVSPMKTITTRRSRRI